MPSDIVETATKGTVISAPLGTDLRNASSIRTPLQAIGNRLKFIENDYDARTQAVQTTGALIITDSADTTLGTVAAPTNEVLLVEVQLLRLDLTSPEGWLYALAIGGISFGTNVVQIYGTSAAGFTIGRSRAGAVVTLTARHLGSGSRTCSAQITVKRRAVP